MKLGPAAAAAAFSASLVLQRAAAARPQWWGAPSAVSAEAATGAAPTAAAEATPGAKVARSQWWWGGNSGDDEESTPAAVAAGGQEVGSAAPAAGDSAAVAAGGGDSAVHPQWWGRSHVAQPGSTDAPQGLAESVLETAPSGRPLPETAPAKPAEPAAAAGGPASPAAGGPASPAAGGLASPAAAGPVLAADSVPVAVAISEPPTPSAAAPGADLGAAAPVPALHLPGGAKVQIIVEPLAAAAGAGAGAGAASSPTRRPADVQAEAERFPVAAENAAPEGAAGGADGVPGGVPGCDGSDCGGDAGGGANNLMVLAVVKGVETDAAEQAVHAFLRGVKRSDSTEAAGHGASDSAATTAAAASDGGSRGEETGTEARPTPAAATAEMQAARQPPLPPPVSADGANGGDGGDDGSAAHRRRANSLERPASLEAAPCGALFGGVDLAEAEDTVPASGALQSLDDCRERCNDGCRFFSFDYETHVCALSAQISPRLKVAAFGFAGSLACPGSEESSDNGAGAKTGAGAGGAGVVWTVPGLRLATAAAVAAPAASLWECESQLRSLGGQLASFDLASSRCAVVRSDAGEAVGVKTAADHASVVFYAPTAAGGGGGGGSCERPPPPPRGRLRVYELTADAPPVQLSGRPTDGAVVAVECDAPANLAARHAWSRCVAAAAPAAAGDEGAAAPVPLLPPCATAHRVAVVVDPRFVPRDLAKGFTRELSAFFAVSKIVDLRSKILPYLIDVAAVLLPPVEQAAQRAALQAALDLFEVRAFVHAGGVLVAPLNYNTLLAQTFEVTLPGASACRGFEDSSVGVDLARASLGPHAAETLHTCIAADGVVKLTSLFAVPVGRGAVLATGASAADWLQGPTRHSWLERMLHGITRHSLEAVQIDAYPDVSGEARCVFVGGDLYDESSRTCCPAGCPSFVAECCGKRLGAGAPTLPACASSEPPCLIDPHEARGESEGEPIVTLDFGELRFGKSTEVACDTSAVLVTARAGVAAPAAASAVRIARKSVLESPVPDVQSGLCVDAGAQGALLFDRGLSRTMPFSSVLHAIANQSALAAADVVAIERPNGVVSSDSPLSALFIHPSAPLLQKNTFEALYENFVSPGGTVVDLQGDFGGWVADLIATADLNQEEAAPSSAPGESQETREAAEEARGAEARLLRHGDVRTRRRLDPSSGQFPRPACHPAFLPLFSDGAGLASAVDDFAAAGSRSAAAGDLVRRWQALRPAAVPYAEGLWGAAPKGRQLAADEGGLAPDETREAAVVAGLWDWIWGGDPPAAASTTTPAPAAEGGGVLAPGPGLTSARTLPLLFCASDAVDTSGALAPGAATAVLRVADVSLLGAAGGAVYTDRAAAGGGDGGVVGVGAVEPGAAFLRVGALAQALVAARPAPRPLALAVGDAQFVGGPASPTPGPPQPPDGGAAPGAGVAGLVLGAAVAGALAAVALGVAAAALQQRRPPPAAPAADSDSPSSGGEDGCENFQECLALSPAAGDAPALLHADERTVVEALQRRSSATGRFVLEPRTSVTRTVLRP